MPLEVALKFSTSCLDELRSKVKRMQGAFRWTVEEEDLYFSRSPHGPIAEGPCLRLRRRTAGCLGTHAFLTWRDHRYAESKGPNEQSLPLDGQANELLARATAFLTATGWRVAATVVKTRTLYELDWEGVGTLVRLDQVDGPGAFVELAQPCVLWRPAPLVERELGRLAALLPGLGPLEERTYLELVREGGRRATAS